MTVNLTAFEWGEFDLAIRRSVTVPALMLQRKISELTKPATITKFVPASLVATKDGDSILIDEAICRAAGT